MFTTLLQIAKNTFRESLREPIYLLMMISALVLIGFFPVLTLYVFWAQEKMVIDSSMAVMMVFGWGLAIMLSSYTISREIDNGTALLLLSKPVQRPVFIIAKILGIMAANFVFCVITGIASLIALRVSTDQFWIDNFMLYGFFVAIALALGVAGIYNYVTRGPFCSAAVVALLCIACRSSIPRHPCVTASDILGIVDGHIGDSTFDALRSSAEFAAVCCALHARIDERLSHRPQCTRALVFSAAKGRGTAVDCGL